MCRRTCEGLCCLHFDERHVAVVGIEVWMSPCSFVCLVFGESRRYLHACRERDYAKIDIANFGVT